MVADKGMRLTAVERRKKKVAGMGEEVKLHRRTKADNVKKEDALPRQERKTATKRAKKTVAPAADATPKVSTAGRRGRKPGTKRADDAGTTRQRKVKGLNPPPDVRRTIEFINAVPDEQMPYVLATAINHRDMVRNYQESIKLSLLKFLTDNLSTFYTDFVRLEDEPALRMRLLAEVSKLVLAKPRPPDDAEVVEDDQEAMMRRMFGLTM
jgi:hypothetical protein